MHFLILCQGTWVKAILTEGTLLSQRQMHLWNVSLQRGYPRRRLLFNWLSTSYILNHTTFRPRTAGELGEEYPESQWDSRDSTPLGNCNGLVDMAIALVICALLCLFLSHDWRRNYIKGQHKENYYALTLGLLILIQLCHLCNFLRSSVVGYTYFISYLAFEHQAKVTYFQV